MIHGIQLVQQSNSSKRIYVNQFNWLWDQLIFKKKNRTDSSYLRRFSMTPFLHFGFCPNMGHSNKLFWRSSFSPLNLPCIRLENPPVLIHFRCSLLKSNLFWFDPPFQNIIHLFWNVHCSIRLNPCFWSYFIRVWFHACFWNSKKSKKPPWCTMFHG